MSKYTKILSVAAGAAAMAAASFSSAEAGNRWPNWYVGLKGSVPFVGEEDLSQNGAGTGKVDFDTGWGASVALGYTPVNSPMRYELEYMRTENDIDAVTGTTGPADGDLAVDAVMFNVFYDMVSGGQLVPYVGGGLGWAKLGLDSTTLGLAGDTDTKLAYQVMAGFSYEPKMAHNTVLSVGYRYLSAFDEASFGSGASATEIEYDSHNVELGARFRF